MKVTIQRRGCSSCCRAGSSASSAMRSRMHASSHQAIAKLASALSSNSATKPQGPAAFAQQASWLRSRPAGQRDDHRGAHRVGQQPGDAVHPVRLRHSGERLPQRGAVQWPTAAPAARSRASAAGTARTTPAPSGAPRRERWRGAGGKRRSGTDIRCPAVGARLLSGRHPGGDRRQDMVFAQGCQGQAMRWLQRHPGQFGNFGARRGVPSTLHPPRLGARGGRARSPPSPRRCPARWHRRTAVRPVLRPARAPAPATVLRRVLACTGLDEAAGTVLAHQQCPAAVIQDDRAHDPDRARGVAHFRFCSNSLRMRLYWSSQESART